MEKKVSAKFEISRTRFGNIIIKGVSGNRSFSWNLNNTIDERTALSVAISQSLWRWWNRFEHLALNNCSAEIKINLN